MKTLEELKKEFKNSLTYSYFVFSKTKKPEFRTFEEANSWYNSQNHIAEAVIGMSLDNLMTVVEQAIKEARKSAIQECIDMSDIMESHHETTLEEWKAFKGFRNAMRDKLSQQEV